jgi:CBS-domain-containing membrane protein
MLVSYVDPQTLPDKVLLLRESFEDALTRYSPGVRATTDFSIETPARVVPERLIDDALQDMVRARLRSLLVVDEGSAVLGLITAADILGTRPIQFLQNPLCESPPCRHQDIRVADIMTRWAQLRLLDYYQSQWRAQATWRINFEAQIPHTYSLSNVQRSELREYAD